MNILQTIEDSQQSRHVRLWVWIWLTNSIDAQPGTRSIRYDMQLSAVHYTDKIVSPTVT